VRGPTGIRCAPVEKEKVGERGGRTCGLSLTMARTLLLALTPDNPRLQDAATFLPPSSTHARGTGRPRDRDRRNLGTDATPRDPRDTEGS